MTSSSGDGVDPAHVSAQSGDGGLSVLCPRGHVNAWNYKFCGQCGTPIGVVSWPAGETASASAGKPRKRTALIGGLAALAVVALAVSATVFFVSRSDEPVAGEAFTQGFNNTGGSPASAAPEVCQSAPVVEAESIELSADGLEVQAAFISPCGSDIESNSDLVVTVAEGRRDVAAASFDFSGDPLSIERGAPARRTLVFPRGMYWRTPNMLGEAPALVATRQGKSSATGAVSTSAPSSTMTAAKPAKPAYGSVDGVAKAVLEEIHDADLEDVRLLTLGWVPQISSKKDGLVAAGKTWTNADILDEHLRLRERFAGARLVWSGDWTTFSDPNFWVTVVGPSRQFPFQANSWCDTQGFAVDDCFAKYISSIFGVPGTTVYRE